MCFVSLSWVCFVVNNVIDYVERIDSEMMRYMLSAALNSIRSLEKN